MKKINIKKIFPKDQQRNFIHLTASFEPEIYPYIVDLPPLRVDILTLCCRSFPYSNIVMYDILSYDNSTESK